MKGLSLDAVGSGQSVAQGHDLDSGALGVWSVQNRVPIVISWLISYIALLT